MNKDEKTARKDGHTPGPWRAVRVKNCHGLHAEGYSIETVNRVGELASFGPCKEIAGAFFGNESNARLIAAAPDLLALLKEAVEELRAGYDESGVLEDEKPDWITSRADSAIRKAKGE